MNERLEPNWPLNRDVIVLRFTESTEVKLEVEAKRLLFVLLSVVSVFSVVARFYLGVLKKGAILCLRGRCASSFELKALRVRTKVRASYYTDHEGKWEGETLYFVC